MPDAHLTDGWTAQQVRDAERPLLEAGQDLMATASAGLAAEARRVLVDRRGAVRGARVVLLAGSGSNGGDGLLALAALAADGATGTVVPLGSRLHEAGLAAARAAGAAVAGDAAPAAVARLVADADLVLDAVLGTGAAATPALRSPAREVVAALLPRAAGGPAVVAVDLPSGTGPDDGTMHEPVLPADVTVTFGAVKAGLLLPPAASVAGRVVLVDIGLGPQLAGQEPRVRADAPRAATSSERAR